MNIRRMVHRFMVVAAAGASLAAVCPGVAVAQDPAPSRPAVAPVPVPPDSVGILVQRAQWLVNNGVGADGRALLDSLLERTEPRSTQEAEVLFWRATLAESWEQAQRDYLRLMLEHEGSRRAADAMLRLAQGEVTRGDRAAALRYLERLAREAPESAARAEAGLWHGRLLVERGSRDEGCAVLRETRGRVPAGALELENQYEYLLRGCAATPTAAQPAPTPASPPASPPPQAPVAPASAPAAATPTAPPEGDLVWSVQVAALSTAAEAAAFAAEVRSLGFDARVDGSAAPFRVRFGRYATRAEAQAAMTRYRAQARADAFLTQVPRG